MYQQVYFHPVRRIYDIHLKDFLKEWLPEGRFSIDLREHLSMTDHEVTAALMKAARESSELGHVHAGRIVERKHYKLLYQPTPDDFETHPEAGKAIYETAKGEFGSDALRRDEYTEKGGPPDFRVLCKDGRITSAYSMSTTLRHLPIAQLDYTFISPEKIPEARTWLEKNRDAILGRT